MDIVKIGKGKGKYRTIYIPNKDERANISQAFPGIRDIMVQTCDFDIVHGFMPGRSPVTNAAFHIGYGYTLNMDMASWFDTVRKDMLGLVPDYLLEHTLVDGIPRQGLPTSPMLANIAASKMDTELAGLGGVYTRYADDLTFSVASMDEAIHLRETVPALVCQYGFEVNTRKTKIQGWRTGRRIITGLAVSDTDVHETRKNRRRRRAASHQGHCNATKGLSAWWGCPGFPCPLCWRVLVRVHMPSKDVILAHETAVREDYRRTIAARVFRQMVSHMWKHHNLVHEATCKLSTQSELRAVLADLATHIKVRGSVLDYGDAIRHLQNFIAVRIMMAGT